MTSAEVSSQATAKEVDSAMDTEACDLERNAIEDVDKEEPDAEPVDPNVVNFDGPDDPENPMNWPTGRKTTTIALVTMMTLLSYGCIFPFVTWRSKAVHTSNLLLL
jgi:hypothetical protein